MVSVLGGAHARSQEPGDLQKGRSLVREVCAPCHAVGTQELRSPNSDAPTFVTIASTPGMTEAALNSILHTSHQTMPNVILSASDTSDIVAYILSLKK
jgi:mono/diheme cytochrome c family protein